MAAPILLRSLRSRVRWDARPCAEMVVYSGMYARVASRDTPTDASAVSLRSVRPSVSGYKTGRRIARSRDLRWVRHGATYDHRAFRPCRSAVASPEVSADELFWSVITFSPAWVFVASPFDEELELVVLCRDAVFEYFLNSIF